MHRVANALLSTGLAPGDRVVLLLGNTPEFVEVEQALLLSGLVRVALSPRLHVRYVVQIVRD